MEFRANYKLRPSKIDFGDDVEVLFRPADGFVLFVEVLDQEFLDFSDLCFSEFLLAEAEPSRFGRFELDHPLLFPIQYLFLHATHQLFCR